MNVISVNKGEWNRHFAPALSQRSPTPHAPSNLYVNNPYCVLSQRLYLMTDTIKLFTITDAFLINHNNVYRRLIIHHVSLLRSKHANC